jgi:hypothetical protein
MLSWPESPDTRAMGNSASPGEEQAGRTTSVNKNLVNRVATLERLAKSALRPSVTLVFVDDNGEVVMTAGPEGRWHRSEHQSENAANSEKVNEQETMLERSILAES